MARYFTAPSTMRAWQYRTTSGGMEKNLVLDEAVALPTPKPNQHLVQVLAASINPADYKGAEHPIIGLIANPKPATPGLDFAGVVVTPAANSPFKAGDLVFGISGNSIIAGGALREFTLAMEKFVLPIPGGVSVFDAASVCVGGLSAYQSIVPHVKKGDHIFINGGSGGTGMFGIQIAKVVGCHVTVTYSTKNIDLCKSLGADVVIDYTKGNLVEALVATGVMYDHIVDNIGFNDELIWKSYLYAKPQAVYIMVGGTPALSTLLSIISRKLWPSFLGGMRNKYSKFMVDGSKPENAAQVAQWIAEGKIKVVVDHKYPFEETPEAFARLKTSRAQGKILIDVASETYKNSWTD